MKNPLPPPVGTKTQEDGKEVYMHEQDCFECKYYEELLIAGNVWANCKQDWICAKEELEDVE